MASRVEVSLRSMEDRLVRARLTRVFAASPLSSAPDKTGMLRRLGRLQNSRPYFCVFLRIQVRTSSHTKGLERSRKQRARPEERTLFPISLLILRKKPTVLQSRFVRAQIFTISKLVPGVVNR